MGPGVQKYDQITKIDEHLSESVNMSKVKKWILRIWLQKGLRGARGPLGTPETPKNFRKSGFWGGSEKFFEFSLYSPIPFCGLLTPDTLPRQLVC